MVGSDDDDMRVLVAQNDLGTTQRTKNETNNDGKEPASCHHHQRRTTRCVPVDISTTFVRRVLVDRMLRMLRGFVTRHASTLWMVARICRNAEVTEAHGSVATGSEQSSDSGAV